MQWFMILAKDVANSAELRAKHRDEHRKRLEAMQADRRILIAGPLPVDPARPDLGVAGSLIVACFEDIDAAWRWADDDPFSHGGVYESVEVRHYKPIFGATG